MAGLPWFELDVDMPDDPKVAGLVARLKNPCAGWYVVRLYAYCYKHAQDRFSGPGAPATIEDTAARWKGKTGVLLSALVAEGFVDHGDGDTLIVHGVENRLAPHLAKRERDAERLRERRANVARSSQRRSGGVAGDKDKDKERDERKDDEEGASDAIVLTEDRRWPEAFVVYRHILAVCCVTRMPSGEVDWESLQAEAVRLGVDVACQEVTRAVEAKRKRRERIAHLSFFVAALKRAARPVEPEQRDVADLPENKRNWVTA